jgi:DNA processing protein
VPGRRLNWRREVEAPGACDACVVRTWLLGRLAGHLDHGRSRIAEVLSLGDEDLIAAVGGRRRAEIARERERIDPAQERRRCAAAGLQVICRCDVRYPAALAELESAPAVLHVAGGGERFAQLVADQPVAIVGTRKPSDYGRELAGSLARSLGGAGLTVISGMAPGVDSAAHAGALAAAAPTVAVLPGAAGRPYPPALRSLFRAIVTSGVAVWELPPGTSVRRWMFPARNRVIAALAAMTVVVEAPERSGSLITAAFAGALGRPVGAVPGRVTSELAAGPHRLLRDGSVLVRGPQDVLDELFGAGVRKPRADRARPALEPELEALLGAISAGREPSDAIALAGLTAGAGLAALSALELAGYLRRGPGGAYTVVP